LFDNYNSKSIGRIVLTGVSGSGKTTILNTLSNRGYNIVDESARTIIKDLKQNDPSKLPWNNRGEFQKLVEQKQITNFIENNNCFFDRGIVDEIVYNKAYGREIKKDLLGQCVKYKYDKVFLFPPFKDIYTSDDERVEDFQESSRLYPLFIESYKSLGYSPIIMINDSVENRIDFLLQSI
jgi:predicted ATPase